MPNSASTYDLVRLLHASGCFDRLRDALEGCETMRRESPVCEAFDFTACQHAAGCTICLSGWVEVAPRSGALTVTVRRVASARWLSALVTCDTSLPATADPFSLGPLPGAPGWEQVSASTPDVTAAQSCLTLHAHSAQTYFMNHADPAHLVATVSITPACSTSCESAWEQGRRLIAALTDANAHPTTRHAQSRPTASAANR